MTVTPPRRVFISYSWDSETHIAWVTSLAERLTRDGIEVMLDQWDTPLGSDLAVFMETGLTEADRVLVVSSSAYVQKANGARGGVGYEKQIMTAEMMRDLTANRVVALLRNNADSSLVPTFLSSRKFVDFRDDSRFESSYQELIHDLYGRSLRQRPTLGTSPFGDDDITRTPAFGNEPLWAPLKEAPNVRWREAVFSRESGYFNANTFVEVELVPVQDQRIEVRRLQTLSDDLASLGRGTGFFGSAEALDIQANGTETWARAAESRSRGENGILVTRTGQRGFWISLPRDTLGAVLDASDLTARITSGLQLLGQLPLSSPSRFAVAAAMGPLTMVTVGSISVVGNRNSAQSSGFGMDKVQMLPEDSIASSSVSSTTRDVAEEIVARLMANFRS